MRSPRSPVCPSAACPGVGNGDGGTILVPPHPPQASSHRWTTLPITIPPRIPFPRAVTSRCQTGSIVCVCRGCAGTGSSEIPQGWMNPCRWGKGRDAPGEQDQGKKGCRTGMGCTRRQDSRCHTPRQSLGYGWSSAPSRHGCPGSTPRPHAVFLRCRPSVPRQDLRRGGQNPLPVPAGDRAEVTDGSWAGRVWGGRGG